MRSRVLLVLFSLAQWSAQRVPVRTAYWLAGIAGSAAFLVWPRGRRAATANFLVVNGGQESAARRLARRSLANYCRYLVDFLRVPTLTREEVARLVAGDAGFELLDRACVEGRGVLIACMHFGNWDLGAAAAVNRGYQLSVVVETFGDTSLDEAVAGARKRLGMKLIRMERPGPSAVRALRKGELVAVLVDRPLVEGGVAVSFFGRKILVPHGAARLAMAGKALILPVAFARASSSGGRIDVLCSEAFAPPSTGNGEADVAEAMGRIFHAHEEFIRARPDQWYMFRRMWPDSGGGS